MGINRGTVLDLINDVHRAGGFKDYNSYSYLFNQVDTMPESKEDAEPHWIPVTERLPKSKEEDLEYPTVLICFENEEIMLGCFYESTKEWGTGEYFDKKCNPIAWMPLPEPYKGVTT